jgi:hypothetical protein
VHVGLSHQWHSAPDSRQLYINMFSALKEALQARSQYGYKRLEEEPCDEEDERKKEEEKKEEKKKEEEKEDTYTNVYNK